MRLIQVVGFLKSVLNKPVYPNQFPFNSNDENAIVVDVQSGDYDTSIMTMNIQLMYRSIHPRTADEIANTQVSLLHNMTNQIYEDWQIVLVKCTNPSPFFVGQDNLNMYLYTVDYRLLVTKIN